MGKHTVREGFFYTKGDTWAHREADGSIRMGITDYAQIQLKEIEYLDLAAEGDEVTQNESLGEVESKKAVSEMLSPLTGVIGSVNESAVDTPGLLNKDPYGEGWIVTIECDDYDSQVQDLMDAAAYAAYRA